MNEERTPERTWLIIIGWTAAIIVLLMASPMLPEGPVRIAGYSLAGLGEAGAVWMFPSLARRHPELGSAHRGRWPPVR